MATNRRMASTALALGAIVAAVWAAPARADIGRRIFRGLTFGLSPSIGTLQNGPLPNQNIFRQHFIRNIPGQGFGYEFTRTFGTDTFGNPQQLDVGPLNVALQGTWHNRFEVNTRFIPEFNFTADSGGAALNYAIQVFTGAQNYNLQGAFNGNIVGTINALGFYTIQVNGTNTANQTISGFFVTDDRPVDFDIGPVNVTGNIFIDMIAGVFQAVGNSVAATELLIPSAASASKEKQADVVTAALRIDPLAAGLDLEQMFAQVLVQAIFAETLADLTPEELASLQSTAQTVVAGDPDPQVDARTVPEPGTLALLAMPMLVVVSRRGRGAERRGRPAI